MGVDAQHRPLVSLTPRFLTLTGARLPIVQAPMAGFSEPALAIAAIRAGGVGSLPAAMLSPDTLAEQVGAVRAACGEAAPINLNFFAHRLGEPGDDGAWRAALAPFCAAEAVTRGDPPPLRQPFDAAMAAALRALRPPLVSFHFGLPAPDLLAAVRDAGARIIGNATTVAEARVLADAGCDFIIAQGAEAGGHAGHFLTGHHPVGLIALVPQIADAVAVPVIAAGGIADPRGAAAAMMLGAAAIQVGTAYLKSPDARALAVHRAAIGTADAERTVFTNLFSGGIARGLPNRLIDALGPVSDVAPPFPHASTLLAPLRRAAEADGRGDYSPLWTGQAAPLARLEDAGAITAMLGNAARRAAENAMMMKEDG